MLTVADVGMELVNLSRVDSPYTSTILHGRDSACDGAVEGGSDQVGSSRAPLRMVAMCA